MVYHKKTSGLQRIKESKLDYAYKTLHLDIKKISVCFFLSEFLTRISQNDDDQKDNFDFIKDKVFFWILRFFWSLISKIVNNEKFLG